MVNYSRKDHKKLKKDYKKSTKSDKKDQKYHIEQNYSKKVKKCYGCGRISRKKELIKVQYKKKRRQRCPACLRLIPEHPKT